MIFCAARLQLRPRPTRTRGSFFSPRSFTCRCCWSCWRRARSSPSPRHDRHHLARTRRNNLVTLILLILFAIGLCAIVVLSMRVHARKVHEAEHASPATSLLRQSNLSFAA